ncbi:hypothetical protein EJB05_11021 [Eragrostis curvula]|uniref:Uncharacterized protein n=1 Tax=Eragrostis curvula TaxID=38414 RepID=A0A5J9VNF6_9POAL|nr:hypothetical protein EJB05_11021 [Eragrostis curvula]
MKSFGINAMGNLPESFCAHDVFSVSLKAAEDAEDVPLSQCLVVFSINLSRAGKGGSKKDCYSQCCLD